MRDRRVSICWQFIMLLTNSRGVLMSKLELQAEQCRFLQTAIISHVVLKPTNKTKLKMFSLVLTFTSIIAYFTIERTLLKLYFYVASINAF